MKKLLLVLLAFFAGSALAQTDPQNCSLPAGTLTIGGVPGNPGFSFPIINQFQSYSCGPIGPHGFGVGTSPAGACQNLSDVNGYALSVASCAGSGGGGACQWVGGGSASWAGPNGAAGCSAGYTQQGSGACKSNIAIAQDAVAAAHGIAITRNSNGVPSHVVEANGDTWNVDTFDSVGRPVAVTGPHSTAIAYDYAATSAQPYRVTQAGVSVYIMHNANGQIGAVNTVAAGQLGGNVYTFKYSATRKIGPYPALDGVVVSTATKDCASARKGSPIACGTVVGADPPLDPYIVGGSSTSPNPGMTYVPVPLPIVVFRLLTMGPFALPGIILATGGTPPNFGHPVLHGTADLCTDRLPDYPPNIFPKGDCTAQYDKDMEVCKQILTRTGSPDGMRELGASGTTKVDPAFLQQTLDLARCFRSAENRRAICEANKTGVGIQPIPPLDFTP